mmetsp:Transcript_117752/g.379997  ORF Transcript_117752/g.379997 Transcript_117752/m.379997 type:complete len:322 (-) Transcript_117752:140-1105(-)
MMFKNVPTQIDTWTLKGGLYDDYLATRYAWLDVYFAFTKIVDLQVGLHSENEILKNITKEMQSQWVRLDTFYNWLGNTQNREMMYLGEMGDTVKPAQFALHKARIEEFRHVKNEVLHNLDDLLAELMDHLAAQITDPMMVFGKGVCVDSQYRPYSTYEKVGCERPLECMAGCRTYKDACRGASLHTDEKGCGRCELRVEPGFILPLESWTPAWRDGRGTGEVMYASGILPDKKGSTCYKHIKPAFLRAKSMQLTMYRLGEQYISLKRDLRTMLFRLDTAFTLIMSSAIKVSKRLLDLLDEDLSETPKDGKEEALMDHILNH